MSTDTPPPDAPAEPETAGPAASTADRYLAVQRSDEFAGLRRALRGFIFPMTVAFFLWYALYVILSAYARDFMGTRLFGSNINVALIFGLLQFVSTFLIAWLYSRFADRKIDPIADRIRAEMGEVTHEHGPRG
ncbi:MULTISPECIES: DUF485 domain-containing protein [Micromonospora]|uniref:Clumping factor B n=1 Tax=Micromonospora haikouensis TaxID=686309 RepID=A0A0D0UZS2_9ACTN|nr:MULTISPECIES: DUF485 domain-containing protein [Micromonospora]KIR64322.1 hypothetical protein TK50_01035 [Micromonospora haikouensis]